MYDEREKAQRDYEWKMAALEEAREEARQQRFELSMLVGQVQLLQELLEEPETPRADLYARPNVELSSLVADLKERFNSAEQRRRDLNRRDQDRG